MTISKKLFLITTMALNLGSLLNAYNENTNQEIFNFAVTLSKEKSNNAKVIANWLLQEVNQEINTHNNMNIDRIELIINAPLLTTEQKLEHLTKIKPSFISKYAINPLCNIASTIQKGLILTATTAAIVAVPGALIFSAEAGAHLAEDLFGKLLIHWQ